MASGNLSGNLGASVGLIAANVLMGVDEDASGGLHFFVDNSSSLSVQNLTANGSVNGSLSIGDLIGIGASGTATLTINNATLNFGTDASGNATFVGDTINGSMSLELNFSTQLPFVNSPITWAGNWQATLSGNNQVNYSTSNRATAPNATTVVEGVVGDLVGQIGSFDLLGQVGADLNSKLPLLDQSLAQLFGIPSDGLDVPDVPSLASIASLSQLQAVLPAGFILGSELTSDPGQAMTDLIDGQKVDLIT